MRLDFLSSSGQQSLSDFFQDSSATDSLDNLSHGEHQVDDFSEEHIALLCLRVKGCQQLGVIEARSFNHHVGDDLADQIHKPSWSILDVNFEDLGRQVSFIWLLSIVWIVQVVVDQLGAVVDIGPNARRALLFVRVKTKR